MFKELPGCMHPRWRGEHGDSRQVPLKEGERLREDDFVVAQKAGNEGSAGNTSRLRKRFLKAKRESTNQYVRYL